MNQIMRAVGICFLKNCPDLVKIRYWCYPSFILPCPGNQTTNLSGRSHLLRPPPCPHPPPFTSGGAPDLSLMPDWHSSEHRDWDWFVPIRARCYIEALLECQDKYKHSLLLDVDLKGCSSGNGDEHLVTLRQGGCQWAKPKEAETKDGERSSD